MEFIIQNVFLISICMHDHIPVTIILQAFCTVILKSTHNNCGLVPIVGMMLHFEPDWNVYFHSCLLTTASLHHTRWKLINSHGCIVAGKTTWYYTEWPMVMKSISFTRCKYPLIIEYNICTHVHVFNDFFFNVMLSFLHFAR